MTASDQNDAITFARAEEQLRPETETFEQQKRQAAYWFGLRLAVGYVSVAALVLIMLICFYILINNTAFPAAVVTAAGATLFGDVLGLLGSIWKIVLNPGSVGAVTPVTRVQLPKRLSGGA